MIIRYENLLDTCLQSSTEPLGNGRRVRRTKRKISNIMWFKVVVDLRLRNSKKLLRSRPLWTKSKLMDGNAEKYGLVGFENRVTFGCERIGRGGK